MPYDPLPVIFFLTNKSALAILRGMADEGHLAILEKGVRAWNQWRAEALATTPDLREAYLDEADLRGINLCGAYLTKAEFRSANLRKADFSDTYLDRVDLNGADLTGANLHHARIGGSDLHGANLKGAVLASTNLFTADLSEANLVGADMEEAYLFGTNLIDANLTRANLKSANLTGAGLIGANLTGADLQSACLQKAVLDDATLTNAKLWETQRAGWSIKGVICKRVFWDKDGEKATEYAPGEFEKLYSSQSCIELFYEGGITPVELNTLPALLHHLATKHPEANIRLRTVEETGGGAKITISLGEVDDETKEKIEADANQVWRAQLALRASEARRLQILEDYKGMLENMTKALLTAGGQQINFYGPVHAAALPSGNASVKIQQTINDNAELIGLIDTLVSRRRELRLSKAKERSFEQAAEMAKVELQKKEPDKSAMSRGLEVVKKLVTESAMKAAGKLGEGAASADWSKLLHELSHLLRHVT